MVGSQRLSARDVQEVVKALIAGMGDYVFPAKAVAVEQYLQAHESEYAQISAPDALAKRLTADMQAAGHDKHLSVLVFAVSAGKDALPSDAQRHAQDAAMGFGMVDVTRLPGNIGYLRLDGFTGDAEATGVAGAAMRLLSGTDALLLDLRQNGGGSPVMVDALLSYFFAERTQLSSMEWHRDGQVREEQQWTDPHTLAPKYLGKPLYVLTSSDTFSAAEQCTYDLKALRRAVVVGETTGGGANPADRHHPLGFGLDAFIPDGQARNPITHTNWEGSGIQPDVAVPADQALLTAYTQALHAVKPTVPDGALAARRQAALANPAAALHHVQP